MNLLLDTHVVIWYYETNPKMSSVALSLIQDPANAAFVSAASHWEIAIKLSNGKLRLRDPFLDFIQIAIHDQGFAILPIETRHTAAAATLPFSSKHRDPFDRMLVPQAQTDHLAIISADPQLDGYGISRLW